jgi:hypothetical protein
MTTNDTRSPFANVTARAAQLAAVLGDTEPFRRFARGR